MKLGVVGKGGIGKTTVSGLLARAYVERGARVLAIDTDSNPNLGLSLGLDQAASDEVPVLPRSLVVGTGGADSPAALLERYGRMTPAGVTLLNALQVTQAGSGCTCSGHASVRSLLGATIDQADVTLVDMEAGLEHLSRAGGTLAAADILLVVMTPSRVSVLTAARTLVLAEELGIPRVYGLGNRARGAEDIDLLTNAAAEYGLTLAGIVPFDPDVAEAERAGTGLQPGQAVAARSAVASLVNFLRSSDGERLALLRQRERITRRLAQLERSG